MGITGVIAYVVKIPSSPTTIFISFNIRLMDPKRLFKIKCRAYILLFTITTFYKIYNITRVTLSLTINEIFLTSYCTSKHVFKNHIIVADVTTITTNGDISFSTFPVMIEQWRQ